MRDYYNLRGLFRAQVQSALRRSGAMPHRGTMLLAAEFLLVRSDGAAVYRVVWQERRSGVGDGLALVGRTTGGLLYGSLL